MFSKTVAERFRKLMADPSKAAAALRQSEDAYGLNLRSDRPEKILVINSGSSSVKYSFFDTARPANRAYGQVERIGQPKARISHHAPGGAPAVGTRTVCMLVQPLPTSAKTVSRTTTSDGRGRR